jgi:hypothetical protein
MRDDHATDPLDLSGSVARRLPKSHRREPERGLAIGRGLAIDGDDVDVWRLARVLVLVGAEEEPVRAEPVDDGHAARLDGRPAGHPMVPAVT